MTDPRLKPVHDGPKLKRAAKLREHQPDRANKRRCNRCKKLRGVCGRTHSCGGSIFVCAICLEGKLVWTKTSSESWTSGKYHIWVQARVRHDGVRYGVRNDDDSSRHGGPKWITDQAGSLTEAKLIAQEDSDKR